MRGRARAGGRRPGSGHALASPVRARDVRKNAAYHALRAGMDRRRDVGAGLLLGVEVSQPGAGGVAGGGCGAFLYSKRGPAGLPAAGAGLVAGLALA